MDEGPRRMDQVAAGRAAEAARLRVEGLDWGTIAERTGYSAATHANRAARNYLASTPSPDRESARATWRARAEELWAEAYQDVLDRRPGAVRAAAAVMQRAASLDGLDAPTRVDLHSPSETEYAAVVARMVALDREQRGHPLQLEADVFSDQYLEG